MCRARKEVHKTRRAALALFGAAPIALLPALAILPIAAVASPTSSARLADFIAAHEAAVDAVTDAFEASCELTKPGDARVSFLGREISLGADTPRERFTHAVELDFEMTKHTVSRLSPELG